MSLISALETARQHQKLGARCGIYRQAHNEKVTVDELSHLFEGMHLDFCMHDILVSLDAPTSASISWCSQEMLI